MDARMVEVISKGATLLGKAIVIAIQLSAKKR